MRQNGVNSVTLVRGPLLSWAGVERVTLVSSADVGE